MKKIIALCCALLISANLWAQTESLSELIDKCSPAIFKVTTYDAGGKEYAIGTGFFINATGTALSNYHVFEGATKAKIKTNDNKVYLVDKVLAWNKESDMLKFEIKNELNEAFPYLKINGTSPRQGEKIFIIGSPLGLERSVSDGIVASIRQDDKMGETIQVTAPISHGNSGSPLMNMNGEALGVVTYYLENGQNLNFAVSVKNLNILDPVNALRFPEEEGMEKDPLTSDPNQSFEPNNNTGSTGNGFKIDYNSPASTFYYTDSKVKFCTALDGEEQPQNEGTEFDINKKNGSWVYLWVSNSGKGLGTEQIIVDVYKRKGKHGNSYKLLDSQRFAVTPTWPDTHFKYILQKKGGYMFKIYNKENIWIQTGYLTVDYTD